MANPILLYTEINSKVAESFTEKIFATPEKEAVNIWVNGPGGSLPDGWSMLAALNARKAVNMTVTGDASSFYFFMLMFSDYNISYDTSNFLVHRAASYFEEEMTEEDLKDIEARNKIIRSKMESRIDETKFTKVTGKTFDDIFDMKNRLDVRLTAEEAKEIGLIDEIIKLDTKRREEIENMYYNSIAALAQPTPRNSNNSNINKMGNKLVNLIFGDKDPVLLAKIGKTSFVYSNLEIGAKIKATGIGAKPITGSFKADGKIVAVEEDEIVSIDEPKAIEPDVMEALDEIRAGLATINERLDALEGSEATEEEANVNALEEEEKEEKVKALEAEVSAMKKTLVDAKLSVSKPKLPEGEFAGNEVAAVKSTAYQVQKEIDAKAKAKQASRNKLTKGGN